MGEQLPATEITFDAKRVILGIIYHSFDLDADTILQADPETIIDVLEFLERVGFKAYVPRCDWRIMTNGDRLDWLLEASSVARLVDEEGTLYLRIQDG